MKTSKKIEELTPEKKHETAVVLHLFYPELFDEIRSYLDNLKDEFDLYISLPKDKVEFETKIRSFFPDSVIYLCENRGRDITPFIEFLKIIIPLDYKYLLKVHTKKTLHRENGTSWRKDVFDKLLGTSQQIENVRQVFDDDLSLAMIGPEEHVLDSRFYMGRNKEKIQQLLYQSGFAKSIPESFLFVASTMFWARPEIFKPILTAELSTEDFEQEPLPNDGSLAHAVERFLGLLVCVQGKRIACISSDGKTIAPDPFEIYPFATPPAHLRLATITSIVYYPAYQESYAIEHLRIIAPLKAAGIKMISGIVNGEADPAIASSGDAVIFQREFPKNALLYDQIIANARNAGKYIIYEFDDLLFELPENHPERAQELYNTALLPMLSALIDADLVIVPTDELRKVAETYNPNVVLLPNYLDDTIWKIREPQVSQSSEPIIIGYMGSNSHTPDIALLSPVIKELIERYPDRICLEVWGTPLPSELENIDQIRWHPSPTNVYSEFAKFFQTLHFDIVIATLADNLFNRCKSGLKFLEYTAIGSPGVYSNLAPYQGLVNDGVNGFLASNIDEWLGKLIQLIEKPELRKRMALAAQKTVRENWLLSENIKSWQDIFDRLNRSVYLEDQQKLLRAHLVNTINRQLFYDRENLKKKSHLESIAYEKAIKDQEEWIHGQVNEYEKAIKEQADQYQTLQTESNKQILELSSSLETINDRFRQMLDENNRMEEQYRYWESQAYVRQLEVNTLRDQVQEHTRTLNEIYDSRAWKAITRYREGRAKLSGAAKAFKKKFRPVERFIPGRLEGQKKQLIDSGMYDNDYYLRMNPDVRNAGVDPVIHFLRFGGIEGRNPSEQFDSRFYLDHNPDVLNAGVNPLLHYLKFGKQEGRNYQAVKAVPTSQGKVELTPSIYLKTTKTVPEQIILAPELKSLFQEKLRDSYNIALSHDDYLSITGGTQVYIADEQRIANQSDVSYLHVFPYRKGKTLIDNEILLYLGINLDGEHLVETEANEFLEALRGLENKKLANLSIHHSMGFSEKFLQQLLDQANNKAVFWLHDYFSLCPSYNLRRNDKNYCGAPDITSNSCQICSYGKTRAIQAPVFEELFRNNHLEIATPSQFTYDLWQSRFPVATSGKVIPPAILKWKRNSPQRYKGGTLRVGFLGYPLDYKGWNVWLRLVNSLQDKNDYKFFHFSTQQGVPGNYTRVETLVTKENRTAMIDSLRWNQIDAVILWSTVAETFSFTMHEALAAGCYLITNPKSGNIQGYIKQHPEHGLILPDEEALKSLFISDELITRVKEYQINGKPQADLIFGSLEELNQ